MSYISGGGGGGSSGLTVGTTTITGGTNGKGLFDNNGVLGEQAVLTPATSNLTFYVSILSGTIVGGSLYTNGTYGTTASPIALTGGSGTGAKAIIVVAGGVVSAVLPGVQGTGYIVGDVLSATAASIGGTGSGFTFTLTGIGSDSNTGTAILPFLTIQHGVNVLAGYNFQNVYNGLVQVEDGFYDPTTTNPFGAISLPIIAGNAADLYNDGNDIAVFGNATNCDNVILTGGHGNFIFNLLPLSGWRLGGMKLISDAEMIGVPRQAGLNIGWMNFQGTGANTCDCIVVGIEAALAGTDFIAPNSGMTLSGSFDQFIVNYGGKSDFGNGITITLLNTPSFNHFVGGFNLDAVDYLPNFVFVGTATGARFYYQGHSKVWTGNAGPNYFPGDAAGFIDANAMYDGVTGANIQAGLPTTSNVLAGTSGVFKDTTGGGVYLAYNDAGKIIAISAETTASYNQANLGGL